MNSKSSAAVIFSVCLGISATPVYGESTQPQFNRVSLQAHAEREIPKDELTVVVSAQHEHDDPAVVADTVNRDMQWALALVQEVAAVTARSLGYYTNPIYTKQRVTGWRARQDLQLRTTDVAGLTGLVGVLQERLMVTRMHFAPTKATRDRFENELIEEALEAYKRRVAVVRKHMDGREYRIVQLQIQAGGAAPPIAVRTMLRAQAAESVQAPQVASGTSKLSVTVSGTVQFD